MDWWNRLVRLFKKPRRLASVTVIKLEGGHVKFEFHPPVHVEKDQTIIVTEDGVYES